MDSEFVDLVEEACRRPGDYCSAVTTVPALFAFIEGLCCGHHAPHGSMGLPGFNEYILGRSWVDKPWAVVLFPQLGEMPFVAACESLLATIRAWRRAVADGADLGLSLGFPPRAYRRLELSAEYRRELFESIFRRPRMFSNVAHALASVVAFAQGFCCGQCPPAGDGCLPGFQQYVWRRLHLRAGTAWPGALLRELDGKPFDEACERAAQIIQDWRLNPQG